MYHVTADIQYLDGALKGVVIADGFSVDLPEYSRAVSTATWLENVKKTGDFVRAAHTGHRYRVVGHVEIRQQAEDIGLVAIA